MSARSVAIAAENASIDASQERAIVARAKPRTAVESMASRLQMSQQNLVSTLKATVFSAARSDSEFAALIVVANEYGLNPLLKEIYAFPSKGGGVVPMVGVDGWIRIMNEHPQFDGIEFDYHNDAKGKTVAIESVIYRKDRSHPVRVMEYMDECKGNTLPWQKSERRMLRHRALIQGARIAFGFSGIVAEGDEDVIDADFRQVQSLPSRQSMEEELNDEIPRFDKSPASAEGETIDAETGEIATDARGMTEVDEETARKLDAGDQAGNDSDSDDNPSAAEVPADEQRGEAHGEDEKPLWQLAVDKAIGGANAAKNLKYLNAVDAEWVKARAGVPDEQIQQRVDRAIDAARRELRGNGG